MKININAQIINKISCFYWKNINKIYIKFRFLFSLFLTMKSIYSTFIIWIILIWFCFWESYSSELQQAYNWAYQNKITTQDSIEKANMKWNITREEMAKMITNYAINILWKTPDTTKPCYFIDSNINPDLVEFVTKSCQLWLMGQWVTSFRPKDNVTRAEFWTTLSRVLRWDKNEWWSTYYQNHLKALKAEWIMNNISSPMNKEIRWYVMLMLMRSVNDDAKSQEKSNTDNQISDIIKMLE